MLKYLLSGSIERDFFTLAWCTKGRGRVTGTDEVLYALAYYDDQRTPDFYAQACANLSRRLRRRFLEIEHAILTRLDFVPLSDEDDHIHTHGMRDPVRSAIDYALATIADGEQKAPPIPINLIAEIRGAARRGIGLGALLRYYNAGYNQLSDYIVDEAEQDRHLHGAALRRLLREQTSALERLLEQIEVEYRLEPQKQLVTPNEQLAERVRRCLAGELLNTSDLNYDFDSCHVGVVTEGDEAIAALREHSNALDGRLLLVRPRSQPVWAWIGSSHPGFASRLYRYFAMNWPTRLPLGLGEASNGAGGWRLTHQQAERAFSFSLQKSQTVIRYSQIAVVAAVERDEVAFASLRQLVLSPLEEKDKNGGSLRETLEAYFSAERNVSSTAAILGVHRRTVRNRLNLIERKLGRSISAVALEVEVALRLR